LIGDDLSGNFVEPPFQDSARQFNVQEHNMPTNSQGGRTLPLWLMKMFWLLIAAVQVWGGLALLATDEPWKAFLAVPGLLIWFSAREHFFGTPVVEHSP
jgi:hypothetical protein